MLTIFISWLFSSFSNLAKPFSLLLLMKPGGTSPLSTSWLWAPRPPSPPRFPDFSLVEELHELPNDAPLAPCTEAEDLDLRSSSTPWGWGTNILFMTLDWDANSLALSASLQPVRVTWSEDPTCDFQWSSCHTCHSLIASISSSQVHRKSDPSRKSSMWRLKLSWWSWKGLPLADYW